MQLIGFSCDQNIVIVPHSLWITTLRIASLRNNLSRPHKAITFIQHGAATFFLHMAQHLVCVRCRRKRIPQFAGQRDNICQEFLTGKARIAAEGTSP
jgi:hypothetical protein